MKAFEFSDQGNKIVVAANNPVGAREILRDEYGDEFDHYSYRPISEGEAQRYGVQDEDVTGISFHTLSDLLRGTKKPGIICQTT